MGRKKRYVGKRPSLLHRLLTNVMPYKIGEKLYLSIVLFGCILFIVAGFLLSNFLTSGIRKDYQNIQSNQSKQIINVLDMYIDNLMVTANNVGEFDKVKSLFRDNYTDYEAYVIYRDIYKYIDNIKEFDKWKDIYIFPTQNKNLLSTDKKMITSDYSKYEIDIESLFENGSDIQVVPLFSIDKSKEGLISCVRRVRDINTMNVIGHVVVTMENDILQSVLSGTKWSDEDLLVIADNEGEIIYSSNAEKLSKFSLDSNNIRDFLEQENNGFASSGKGYSRYVAKLKKADWHIITIGDQTALAKELLTTQIMFFCVIFMLILLLLYSAKKMVGMFTKPIIKLADLMLDAEKNNYNKMLNIETKDETRMLAISFNKMMYDIRENQVLLKQAQIDSLQKQINPHFLFNTLESIKVLSYSHDYNKVANMIQKLSDMFRYNMNRENQKLTRIKDELEHVKNYLDIQQIRFNDRLATNYSVSDEILNVKILKFVLQPIVENAIVHGLEQSDKLFIVSIDGEIMDNHVVITVSDNGNGIEEGLLSNLNHVLRYPSKVEDRFGIGLKNISERIQLYYGLDYYIRVVSTNGDGTKVVLTIPCE